MTHSEDDEVSFQVLSALFPNVAHLRLDGNFSVEALWEMNPARPQEFCDCCDSKRVHCVHCSEQLMSAVGQDIFEDIQNLINSSTADVCKAALIRRALAAWPKLTQITLQIEDFYETELLHEGTDVKYLYMSETIVFRDAATSELVPKEERKWIVKKV